MVTAVTVNSLFYGVCLHYHKLTRHVALVTYTELTSATPCEVTFGAVPGTELLLW